MPSTSGSSSWLFELQQVHRQRAGLDIDVTDVLGLAQRLGPVAWPAGAQLIDGLRARPPGLRRNGRSRRCGPRGRRRAPSTAGRCGPGGRARRHRPSGRPLPGAVVRAREQHQGEGSIVHRVTSLGRPARSGFMRDLDATVPGRACGSPPVGRGAAASRGHEVAGLDDARVRQPIGHAAPVALGLDQSCRPHHREMLGRVRLADRELGGQPPTSRGRSASRWRSAMRTGGRAFADLRLELVDGVHAPIFDPCALRMSASGHDGMGPLGLCGGGYVLGRRAGHRRRSLDLDASGASWYSLRETALSTENLLRDGVGCEPGWDTLSGRRQSHGEPDYCCARQGRR